MKDPPGMAFKEQVVFLSPITTAPVRAYLPVSDSFTAIPILTHWFPLEKYFSFNLLTERKNVYGVYTTYIPLYKFGK